MSRNRIAACLERSHPGQYILTGIETRRFERRSTFQEIRIADVPGWGRALFLDANVQFLERDEFIYHEHLALLPLLFQPGPRRVLTIGGGDGLALREVLRDKRVKQAVLVDIDAMVIEACRRHLSDLHHDSFDHPEASVIVADAREYLAAGDEPFDVILVDPDGEGLMRYPAAFRLPLAGADPRADRAEGRHNERGFRAAVLLGAAHRIGAIRRLAPAAPRPVGVGCSATKIYALMQARFG